MLRNRELGVRINSAQCSWKITSCCFARGERDKGPIGVAFVVWQQSEPILTPCTPTSSMSYCCCSTQIQSIPLLYIRRFPIHLGALIHPASQLALRQHQFCINCQAQNLNTPNPAAAFSHPPTNLPPSFVSPQRDREEGTLSSPAPPPKGKFNSHKI